MNNSFWTAEPEPRPDTYAAFRSRFVLPRGGEVELRVLGASWYEAWLNGEPLLEGPPRFPLSHPEYQTLRLALPAGDHLLAFYAHHVGVETRLLALTPPFLWCELRLDGELLPFDWRGLTLVGHWAGVRRINPQLGWIEWHDTRRNPADWHLSAFDDAAWPAVRWSASPLPEPERAADLAPVLRLPHPLVPCAEGPLAPGFGHTTDDPPYAFFSRDRSCAQVPARGVWRRYDLGRVRLGRPRFRLRLPAGAEVEFAYAERLADGRVGPWIPLSVGPSCNFDHFMARGGEQTFAPLVPKGGRFLEVHVLGADSAACFLEETFLERVYHPPTEAAFACGDPLLEKIWSVGVETYRACSEDALTDNPTRERGQWLGDAATVGLHIAAVAYHDLRLARRSLVHAAHCARADGLVAGLTPGGPGGPGHQPTYACLWAAALPDYHRLTGDRALLAELWEPALRNMAALRAHWRPDGLHEVPGWNFVDWGYQPDDSPADLACNLIYLGALCGMHAWSAALDRAPETEFAAQADALAALLRARLDRTLAETGWPSLGFHATALALRHGLLDDEEAALDHLAAHIARAFPNDRSAPRNEDSRSLAPGGITPYFAHFVLPLFIERGRMDFVLAQYRSCWGYLLEDGRTTWMEVFDERWSHCHVWSGCPTWQLSRYALGLHPRLDVEPAHFDLRLEPGSLPRASGRVPHPVGGWIDIAWERESAVPDSSATPAILWTVRTDHPLALRLSSGETHRIATAGSLRL